MDKNHEQSIMADDEKIEEYAKSYETTPCLSSRLTRELGKKDLKIEKLQSQLDGARAQSKKERNRLVFKETQTHNENVALKSEIEELREKLDEATEQHLAEIKKLNEFYEKTKEENRHLHACQSCMVDKERLSFRLGYGSLTEQFDWERAVIGMRKDLEQLKQKLYAKDCEVSQLRVKLEGQTILHNPCDQKTEEAFAKAGQKVGDCLPSTCEFAYDTSVYHNTKIMCIAHEHNGSPNPQSRSGNSTRIHFVAVVGERIYDVSNSGTNGVYEEKEYLEGVEEHLGKILEIKRIPVSSFKEKLDEGGYEWSAKNLHAYSGIVMNEMYKKHLPDVPCMTKRQITKLLVKKT